MYEGAEELVKLLPRFSTEYHRWLVERRLRVGSDHRMSAGMHPVLDIALRGYEPNCSTSPRA